MISLKKKSFSSKFWVWLIPALILIGSVYLYPLLEVIRFSFSNARIGKYREIKFTLNSYRDVLFDKECWHSLAITLYFALGSVILQLGLGLVVALLINYNLPGSGFVKLSMIIAWVVPGVITGVLWQMLYSTSSWGVINNFLEKLGFTRQSFLAKPFSALNCALVANIWRGTGFSGIMQYAALKAIPKELFESASLDGANRRQTFFYITLPQLRPMLLINLVLITIASINTYDSIYSLTGGGPGLSTTVLPLMTYKSVFTLLKLGVGSVYAVILLLISVLLTFLYFQLIDKNREPANDKK